MSVNNLYNLKLFNHSNNMLKTRRKHSCCNLFSTIYKKLPTYVFVMDNIFNGSIRLIVFNSIKNEKY